MIFAFRWKELCLAMPLICTLSAIGFTWPLHELARLIRRFRRA
jgi:hypothetical protein